MGESSQMLQIQLEYIERIDARFNTNEYIGFAMW